MAENVLRPDRTTATRKEKRARLYRIRNRLMLSFVLVAVVPLIIVSIVAYRVSAKAAENNADKLLSAVLSLKKSAIHRWIEGLQQSLQMEARIEVDKITAASLLTPEVKTSDWTKNYKSHMDSLTRSLRTDQGFDAYFVLNPEGEVLYASNPSYLGLALAGEAFFQNALAGKSIFLSSTIKPLNRGGISLTETVKDDNHKILGYITAVTSLAPIEEILQTNQEIGSNIEIYLVGSDFSLLTHPSLKNTGGNHTQVLTNASLNAILGKQSGSGSYENLLGEEVVGVYHWLPELNVAIFAEQIRREIYQPAQMTLAINVIISLILIVATIIFGLAISNSIGTPLEGLVSTAQQIAKGDIHLEAKVHQPRDEIADLAESFNQMTHQLRENIGELERRVAARTAELETRTSQLLIASQLSNKITSILDTQELVNQAVNLIRDRFDLYYVGLFLVDETNTWAVLKAGTGPEGQAMLARGHRLKIGDGMVGWSIQNGKARIALKVSDDPVRLSTPDLPETRSEVAVPLRSRGLVIGALTIQSTIPDAFDETILATFQTMADQIAVAIDNARLFAEAEKSLEAIQRAYGEMTRKAWLERLRMKPLIATRNEQGVTISQSLLPTALTEVGDGNDKTNGTIRVPIKVRGNVIGTLEAQKPDDGHEWSEEELVILNTLTEQLGVALDGARLFEETKSQAERERLISQITNRVRETLDIDTILQTATIEIQRALDLDEVEVQMSQNIPQETLT